MIELPVVGQERPMQIRPEKILALGLNYAEHVAESGRLGEKVFEAEIPTEPVVFTKTLNTLCGPGAPIRLPSIVKKYDFKNPRTDFEAELVLVIGTGGKNIPEERVYDHIFGYTCGNDVSQRNIQKSDQSGWFRGKSFDTFFPVGPVIVPHSQIRDPQKLTIEGRLNGTVHQRATTADMIFPIPTIVSYLSRNFTLAPGDLVLTGTPAGVSPIKAGDTVEIEIEGIGILSNPVSEEAAP
jgi:2-keto-4-pentenoate hydratase/2-oxohepta-3-ene-1,7-dioic acid hydratase in catechol pathway